MPVSLSICRMERPLLFSITSAVSRFVLLYFCNSVPLEIFSKVRSVASAHASSFRIRTVPTDTYGTTGIFLLISACRNLQHIEPSSVRSAVIFGQTVPCAPGCSVRLRIIKTGVHKKIYPRYFSGAGKVVIGFFTQNRDVGPIELALLKTILKITRVIHI